MAIAFIDLAAQQKHLRTRIDDAIARVLDEGHYIMGPQVRELEEQLAAFSGVKHCLTCANGTDALQLALMALKIGAGDAVFVPAFTFAATAEVVPLLNATPVFVDCLADTFNMDPKSLKRAITHAKEQGLRPACVIPVDLFGLPAAYDEINAIAREHGMKVISDSAQGYGSVYKGRRSGSFADISTTSFFPAKPLGCYGDGGAVFTDDDEIAALIESFRVHGKGTHKYSNVRIGVNSRLDTIQAAILIEKLAVYQEELDKRQSVAESYDKFLAAHFRTPHIPSEHRSAWAQYTIQCSSGEERTKLQAKAKEAGVPTMIYYPTPLHKQEAYSHYPTDPHGLPVSEQLSAQVVSLPMHPYLATDEQQRVCEALLED